MNQKLNYAYLIGMAITGSLGFWILGYCFGYFNVFTSITHKQHMYYDKFVIEDEDLFNSVVSGLIPIGAIFGSLMINPIVEMGRRTALILIAAVFTIASLSTMIFNFYFLVFGRLVMGV